MSTASPAGRPVAALILNRGAGPGSAEAAIEQLVERFDGLGCEARVTLVEGDREIADAVNSARASRVSVVVAGGGDGTVSTVAGFLVGQEIPLGILPLGTLNHFARDLGIPLEIPEAVAVIAAGVTAAVDVGEVNQRIFLNNASLGLYARIVRYRQRHPARGILKWVVAAWLTLRALARYQSMALRVEADGETVLRRTPIVMVGNNEYRAEGLAAGTRESLSDGLLAIYIVKEGGRRHPFRLLRLAWHLVLGRALDGDRLELLRVGAATVESRFPRLHLALDGEVLLLETPLEFRIRPGALRVVVPG